MKIKKVERWPPGPLSGLGGYRSTFLIFIETKALI
jgi:hypothetical protein